MKVKCYWAGEEWNLKALMPKLHYEALFSALHQFRVGLFVA